MLPFSTDFSCTFSPQHSYRLIAKKHPDFIDLHCPWIFCTALHCKLTLPALSANFIPWRKAKIVLIVCVSACAVALSSQYLLFYKMCVEASPSFHTVCEAGATVPCTVKSKLYLKCGKKCTSSHQAARNVLSSGKRENCEKRQTKTVNNHLIAAWAARMPVWPGGLNRNVPAAAGNFSCFCFWCSADA